MQRNLMIGFQCVVLVGLALLGSSPAQASSFQGKTVTIIVGNAAGGGTSALARLLAPFLGHKLPGKPALIVRNLPGANGIVANNYFAQQAPRDGLVLMLGTDGQVDPLNFRKPQAHYAPDKYEFIGGVQLGGNALVINKAAERRLLEKSAPPVMMGITGGTPRSTMRMAAWGRRFLGWNMKWVPGYRGTKDLMLAPRRGEIDMTAITNITQIKQLVHDGHFMILVQSGWLSRGNMVARTDFGRAPLIADMLKGKIKEPIGRQSFTYWLDGRAIDKWLALPPGTPRAIVDTYRRAFDRVAQDAEFAALSNKLSEGLTTVSYGDVTKRVRSVANTSPQAVDYLLETLRAQGLRIAH